MFEELKDFYPTPNNLIKKMLEKIKIEELYYILEPSAGSGTIIDYYKEYYKSHNRRYRRNDIDVNDYVKFDAIEIDDNLTSMLRGKNINVVDRDFLTFEPSRFYDLIIANYPFSQGCEHALKSIKIQERIGGQLLFIINAETLLNPYSNNRKELSQKLIEYNADIEYIDNAFSDSQRSTDVKVALVYISVPMQDTTTMFERGFMRDNPDIKFDGFQSLIPNMNKLDSLIFECDLIKKSVIELYKEKRKIDDMLEGMKLKAKISICNDNCNAKNLTINEFINSTNLEYWQKFIDNADFKNRLPSKLRDNFTYNMEKQKDISFNKENVKYFYEQLMESIPKSYEETVKSVFESITSKYCYSNTDFNKSIHYYNGWCANQGMKINKKCIIKCSHEYLYRLPDDLNDLNIIFENISGIKDNINEGRRIKDAIVNCEKKIETKFFIMDSYKKQTLHITFKNQEYLNQFNIMAGKGSNALPPDFGEKPYEDMTEEEKVLVEELGIKPFEYIKLSGGKDYLRLTE